MFVIAAVMLLTVILAAGVITFAAYPHRGEQVPAAPWLGDAMARAVDAVPVITADEHAPGGPRQH